MFSYKPLIIQLALLGIKHSDLQRELSLSPTTIAKIRKNKYLSMQILDRICTYLDCNIQDIVQHVKLEAKERPKVCLTKHSKRVTYRSLKAHRIV